MKIFKKFLLAFTLFLAVITFTGCFTTDSVDTLTIKKLPNTTFILNETDINPLMTIAINGEVVELSYDNGNLVSKNEKGEAVYTGNIIISNFILSEVGNRTATISFGDAKSYFDYQVINSASGFAGGNGTINSPYQITNAEQLVNINTLPTTKGVYFKLMNDIDLTSVMSAERHEELSALALIKLFEGVLDGNHKKLLNFVSVSTDKKSSNVIFFELSGATIKDLEIYVNGKETFLAYYGNSYDNRVLTFDNVDIYGKIEAGYNDAPYFIYSGTQAYRPSYEVTYQDGTTETKSTWRQYSVVYFKDCDSSVDNICATMYHSAFVGCPWGEFHFDNCWNHAMQENKTVGVFFANTYLSENLNFTYNDPTDNKDYTITNGVLNALNISDQNTYIYLNNSGNKGYLSFVLKNNGSTDEEINKNNSDNVAGAASKHLVINGELLQQGKVTQIPTYEGNLSVNDDNKLVITNLDEQVTSVKVSLYFQYMASDLGTTTKFITEEFDVEDGKDIITHIYAINTSTIYLLNNYSLNDGETEVEFNDWLKYNVDQKTYVFDGTKVIEDHTCTYGSPYISIYAYNAEGKVVSVKLIKLTCQTSK